jgi:hypothetical protein
MADRIFYTCVEWPRAGRHEHESLEEYLNKKSREGMTLAFVLPRFEGCTLIFTSSFVYP